MIIYANLCKYHRQTDKLIKSIVRNLTKLLKKNKSFDLWSLVKVRVKIRGHYSRSRVIILRKKTFFMLKFSTFFDKSLG
jgi:hypothetical protein